MSQLPDLGPILQIVEILSILGGGYLVARKQGKTEGAVTAGMAAQAAATALQATEISTLREEVKALSKVVTEVAVQNNRIDTQDKRLDNLENKVNELAHGEGFVMPLNPDLMRVLPAR